MSAYDEWAKTRATLAACDGELARLREFIAAGPPARWNRPVGMRINLRGPRPEPPVGYLHAVRRAFRRIRREVWTSREEGLRHALKDRGENWMVS